MEPSVEIFLPSSWYSRTGWFTLAAAAVVGSFGYRSSVIVVLASLCAVLALLMFWFAARPVIKIGEAQFNVGDRAIAWREVKEVNRVRILSPLILRIKLTNSRRKILIYPGELSRVEQLVHLLRKNSHLATFDGVAYRDYWTWSSMAGIHSQQKPVGTLPSGQKQGQKKVMDQPVRMLTSEEEEEIERMYQKLKAVGSLDSRIEPAKSDED